jgi:hypothetical protein
MLLQGKPQIWLTWIERWQRFGVALPLENIVFRAALVGGGKRRSGVQSTMYPRTSLNGMVQQSLDDGRGLMGSCRLGSPSGAMVVLMVGLVRTFALV